MSEEQGTEKHRQDKEKNERLNVKEMTACVLWLKLSRANPGKIERGVCLPRLLPIGR